MTRSSSARTKRLVRRYVRTAASCASAVVFGPFSSEGRARLNVLSAALGHTELPQPRLPQVNAADIAHERHPVVLLDAEDSDGNVTVFELLVLARLTRARRPQRVFEIGTFQGRTTMNLAANAPAEAHIFTLDLPAESEAAAALPLEVADRRYIRKATPGARLHGSGLEGKVTQLLGDSATFDFTSFSRDGVDLVFIDGSHSYEYVCSDSLRALQILRTGGGTIVWHDYNNWPGVSDALHDLQRSHEPFSDLRWIRGTSLALLDRTTQTENRGVPPAH